MEEIFEGTIVPFRIIEVLGAYHQKKIQPEKSLIIFDEIQENPRALTALKYFAEEAPEYAVCCAGSLLGVTLHEGTSLPVGKVDFIIVNPLLFEEFLFANNENILIEWTKEHYQEQMLAILAEKYLDLLKNILLLVAAWIETKDFAEVTDRQKRLLLKAYEDLKTYKIYHLDGGLLRVLCEIEPEIILDSEAVFKEFMGALTE